MQSNDHYYAKNLTAFSTNKSRSDYNNSNESFSLQKHH